MSYVWGNEGPSFEYPTCFRTENRFLTLRAATLFLVALALLWIALSDPEQAQAGAALLRAKVERGSWVPHLVMSLLLFGLGSIDLLRVSRQRRVRLAEGQPAPLAGDLSFHVTGASAGAAWLHCVVTTGRVDPPELGGRYRRVLRLVARQIAHAPTAVQSYLSARVSQVLFSAGLFVALAALWMLAPQRPGVALVAVLFGALAVAQVVYTEWIAERAASPLAVGAVVAVAAVAAGGLTWGVGSIPQLAALKSLSLPVAAALLLACLLLADGLGVLAARGQVDGAHRGEVGRAEASDEFSVDASRLMKELDSELVRRWVDGVPNRRFIRRQPMEARNESLATSVVVLEESQPTLAGKQRDQLKAVPVKSRIWLLALGSIGLLMTAIGGGLWVRMADALMSDAATGWAGAVPALVLIVAGGYAVRVGHLLWSRIEVESTVFMLSVNPPASAAVTDDRETHLLEVRAVRLASIFYAAAEHTLGSRRVLRLVGDAPVAKAFIERVQSFTRRGPVAQAAPKPQRPATGPATALPHAAERGMPRFCPACGTPVLQGARFCQNCGNVLQAT